MTKTEMKGEGKRTTTTKQNTSNSSYFPWTLNRLLFLQMRYLKLIRTFKGGLISSSFAQE